MASGSVVAALVRLRPTLVLLGVRLALYFCAFAVQQLWYRLGEAQAALAIAAIALLVGVLMPFRDGADVGVVVGVALVFGSALTVIEVLSVWRGLWTYRTDRIGVLDRANGWAAAMWSRLPDGLTDAVQLKQIGRSRVPVWLWPCWVLVPIAVLDLARTGDAVARALMAAAAAR
jgi:hypothetical protein